MSVKEKNKPSWTEPGQRIICSLDAGAIDDGLCGAVQVELGIDEVLEDFSTRRVLVASATKVVESEEELGEESTKVLLSPTYLIEETTRLDDGGRRCPEEIKQWVRSPVSVVERDQIRRSVFVDNMGVSVGDLVDLARGQLDLEQVEAVFRAVAELFDDLHRQGWVHLGLTPWNIRVYDPTGDDGFPRHLLDGDASGRAQGPKAELAGDFGADDDIFAGEDQSLGDSERTVVELRPLGDGDEGASQSQEERTAVGDDPSWGGEESAPISLGDSEVSWMELTGETDDVVDMPRLLAILDGIDRLYPAGTIDDEIAVTPGFSSPELLSGMGSESGTSADIFSLGMVLYFLVAGVVPPASVYTRYAPAIPARNFRPTFPPGLQAVISRATRPRPQERFSSVSSMLQAFDEACVRMSQRAAVTSAHRSMMRLESDTHVGIAKKRRNPTNQDSIFSATSEDGRFALVVVADGVSTASFGSGDLASAALRQAATEVWSDTLPAYLMDQPIDTVDVLKSVLNRANRQIVDYVNEQFTPFGGSPHEVMGTTALVAVIEDGLVTLASLGDSRVYLQHGNGMEQMTIDHNLWTLSILEGMPADRALAMPHGDALARCLGTFVVEDRRLKVIDPQPDLFRFQLIAGDTLLMTTDGLVDFAGTNLMASEDNILATLLAEPDPALACLELILLANRGGGGDNIGLSVIRFY